METGSADIDDDWENFLEVGTVDNDIVTPELNNLQIIPKGTDLYISTKTKITYLSHAIDLFSTFWKLEILSYHIPQDGIIKKQMKFNFIDETALLEVKKKLEGIDNVEDYIITQIKNPEGRIKFKDIRKISVGLCNKDITSYRSKKRSAFYNCFVVILRIFHENKYKEVHVKIFNTGKLEIPGIRCDELLKKVMKLLIKILKPITEIDNLSFHESKCETVLINSNFNCGFYINREKLFDILKYKYQINCLFDPCSYPGIQCKYIHNTTRVSFMIFRTGSVLIVGKCDDIILLEIYEFIKELLKNEYNNIIIRNIEPTESVVKKSKLKKRIIYVD